MQLGIGHTAVCGQYAAVTPARCRAVQSLLAGCVGALLLRSFHRFNMPESLFFSNAAYLWVARQDKGGHAYANGVQKSTFYPGTGGIDKQQEKVYCDGRTFMYHLKVQVFF